MSRVLLALPIHSYAGVSGPPAPRLGSLLPILDFAGGIISGIFGASSEKRQLKAQQEMQRQQLRAEESIANRQFELGGRQIDAAVATERIRAINELSALNSAYATQLSAQRVQKQIATEAISGQLLAQTQSGIFELAGRGLEQSSSVARSAPSTATWGIGVLVIGTVVALAWMRARSAHPAPRRRRRWRGRAGRASFSTSASTSPASTGFSPASPAALRSS